MLKQDVTKRQDPFAGVDHVHFSGVKGVGMTALALYLQDMGYTVTGSDLDSTFVTDELLEKRNIPLTEGFSKASFPHAAQLLIYSGGRSKNPQVEEAKARRLPCLSYARALGMVTKGKTTIAVCGVGGKTTTAAMIATALTKTGLNPGFVIGVGGIRDLGVSGRFTPSPYVVVEADEYVSVPLVDPTPKFLYLHPTIIVATNVEYDHPDVYASLEQTLEVFLRFFSCLPDNGLVVANGDSPNLERILRKLAQTNPKLHRVTYGMSPGSDWRLSKIAVKGDSTSFTLDADGETLSGKILVPGAFNAANATAAVAASTHLGVTKKEALKAVSQFAGTRRRFEPKGSYRGAEVFDDYAHHPKEIEATLSAAKQLFPTKKLVVVFQPHTYSRTKALFTEFGRALSLADATIITDIYSSAREKADPTISSSDLARETSSYGCQSRYLAKPRVLKYLRQSLQPTDVLIIMGAGDIYTIAEALVQR